MHIFSILKPILSNLSLTVPTRVIHKNMFFYENKLAQPALVNHPTAHPRQQLSAFALPLSPLVADVICGQPLIE